MNDLHIGFYYGQSFEWPLPAEESASLTLNHSFGSDIGVITLGAAVDVTHNCFKKRIINQLTISRINDLPTKVEEPLPSSYSVQIFPNPVKDYFNISIDGQLKTTNYSYTLYNHSGIVVQREGKTGLGHTMDTDALPPGVYFIRVCLEDGEISFVEKIVKF